MVQAVIEWVARPAPDPVEGSDEELAGAIESGKVDDALIARRVGIGIVVGIPLGMLLTTAIVAVTLAVAGSFTAGSLLAGAWGGFVGGTYLGGVLAFREPEHARAAAPSLEAPAVPPGRKAAA